VREGFWSLLERIDTTTPGGNFVFHVFGALVEFERVCQARVIALYALPPVHLRSLAAYSTSMVSTGGSVGKATMKSSRRPVCKSRCGSGRLRTKRSDHIKPSGTLPFASNSPLRNLTFLE